MPLSFLASAGECELCDAGFVEVAESFSNHAVELLLGSLSQREIEAIFMGEGKRDATVLRSVGAGEEARVVAVLHILSIGFENLRVSAGLEKNLAQHCEIMSEGGSEPQASPAVLIFITMFTSAFTCAALPEAPMWRREMLRSLRIGSARCKAASVPPVMR